MTERLGRNNGGYFGERIDVNATLEACVALARGHGWQIESLPARPNLDLLAFRRVAPESSLNVYVSAGVHGDEPAGPLAVQRLLQQDSWPASYSLWLCPCINPVGMTNNTRGNQDGVDLNRDYLHLEAPEVRAHTEWIGRQPLFDLMLGLHEDWEAEGFYIYELMPTAGPPLAPRIVEAVKTVCPIDLSPEIDGRSAEGGIVTGYPDPATRPRWPEALYFYNKHATHSCTLEAPSDFLLETRVDALAVAVQAALEAKS